MNTLSPYPCSRPVSRRICFGDIVHNRSEIADDLHQQQKHDGAHQQGFAGALPDELIVGMQIDQHAGGSAVSVGTAETLRRIRSAPDRISSTNAIRQANRICFFMVFISYTAAVWFFVRSRIVSQASRLQQFENTIPHQYRRPAEAGFFSRSFSMVLRRVTVTFRTAKARAFVLPIMTISFFARVTPV